MSVGKANVNAEMLKWARQEAGLTLSGAAEKAGIEDTRRKTKEERLSEWESGNSLPSKNQLKCLARAYVQPLLLFYLSSPPVETVALPDFRKLSPEDAALSPRMKSLVARMKARQEEVIDILLEDDEEPEQLPFIGRFTPATPVADFVKDLRASLRLSEAQQRKIRDYEGLFSVLRNRAEDLGIFVIVQGDLGHHTTALEPTEFRGFCLSHPVAPFVVLNGNDAKPALSFTLMHELAHLWLNESGISNTNPLNALSDENRIEAFCNKVASHFLIPPLSLAELWNEKRGRNSYEVVGEIARELSVSRRAVAYRLRLAGDLDFPEWQMLNNRFQADYEAVQARKRAKNEQSSGFPHPYVLKKYQLGARLVSTVLRAVDTGALGYSSASRILGVPSKGFKIIRPKAA